jgi:nucleotide-binding universal stress UspA family protein
MIEPMADSAEAQRKQNDGPDSAHRRDAGTSDATVEALGKLSEALEVVEHARGLLYGFHRLTGTADLALDEAVDLLRAAGHTELAGRVEREIIGRNVVRGRWTFQIVEEYDDGYYSAFKELERGAREELAGGKRHLFEAEMKESRRSHGRPHHEALPSDVDADECRDEGRG